MDAKDIKCAIVTRLVNRNMWGGKHTEHVLSGLPKQVIGSKEAAKALKELIDEKWVLPQLKTKEMHYSLNPRFVKEIQIYLKQAK